MSMNRMRISLVFYRVVDTVVTVPCVGLMSRKLNNSDIKTLFIPVETVKTRIII